MSWLGGVLDRLGFNYPETPVDPRTQADIDRAGELRFVRSQGVEPDIPQWSLSRWTSPRYSRAYDAIWRSQPWVRTAVDFMARNIAQVGLHVFRREGEGEDESRIRLRDHPFAQILQQPDPEDRPPLTAYGLIYGLVQDLGVHGNAFIQKLPAREPPIRLRRIRPQQINWRWPGYGYEREERPFFVRADGREIPLDLSEIVWIRYLSPLGKMGESPLEALRQLLDEYFESAEYRNQLWRNGARMSGWIQRPADAPVWAETERSRFLNDWGAEWSGHSSEAGGTPLLEDGMSFHREVFSAEEAQYLEARKLSREETAAAYFIPPTMLGMTQGATYANTREHHRMLYQDTLGPPMAGIQQDLMAQLLPDLAEFAEVERVYVEFNIQQKLAGDFEEQTRALQSSTGRPYMTANEARARLNLPRLQDPGYDELVTPLNVIVGGQASPRAPLTEARVSVRSLPELALPASAHPGGGLLQPPSPERLIGLRSLAELDRRQEQLALRLREFFQRQQRALSGIEDGDPPSELWDGQRWDRELSGDLLRHLLAMASLSAADLLAQWDPEFEWSDDPLIPLLSAYAGGSAAGINITTFHRLIEAWLSPERIVLLSALWSWSEGSRSDQIALTASTAAKNFGAHDAARAVGLRKKTWRVTSKNPRPSHAALNGEEVPIGSLFSNGARWPGDQQLSVDERAGCTCVLEFTLED